MQRSKGSAALRFDLPHDRTALADLAKSGSARAMLPRATANHPEVVFLNTSGDRLSYALDLAPCTRITANTQTAERAYHARDTAAQVQGGMTVGAGGHLDWLPQETILFEDCHIQRDTRFDLDATATATCLLTEITVLGRRAMGELALRARLLDRPIVMMCERPLWSETVSITPKTLQNLGQPAS